MHAAPSLPKPKEYTSIWFGRRFEGADGADCVSGIALWADRQELVALVASMSTMWRVLDSIDEAHPEGAGSRGPEAHARARSGPGLRVPVLSRPVR